MANALVSGDSNHAADLMALLLLALEQSSLDGGKWEVAYALTLMDDAPGPVQGFCPSLPSDSRRAKVNASSSSSQRPKSGEDSAKGPAPQGSARTRRHPDNTSQDLPALP